MPEAAKTVLVTGGTVRLGLAIAEALRARGWRVLTSSHRDDAGADLVADLSLPDGADRLFDAALALAGGRLDAVVNNAALFAGGRAALAAVNFRSPARLVERLAATGGAAVNVLDARSLAARRGESAYLDSKLGLLEFTLAAASRFAPRLRVNAVAPGPVLAPVAVHAKADATLTGRRPSAADVAAAVALLLEGESFCGVVLPVDAGAALKRRR